jgi:hypothetical protein
VDRSRHSITPAFCSVEVAASLLGISRSSAYNWANEWLDTKGQSGSSDLGGVDGVDEVPVGSAGVEQDA